MEKKIKVRVISRISKQGMEGSEYPDALAGKRGACLDVPVAVTYRTQPESGGHGCGGRRCWQVLLVRVHLPAITFSHQYSIPLWNLFFKLPTLYSILHYMYVRSFIFEQCIFFRIGLSILVKFSENLEHYSKAVANRGKKIFVHELPTQKRNEYT